MRIEYLMESGFPPLEVLADGLPGGMVRFADAESSQFLSAVLLACPYAQNEVHIDLDGPQTSWPYVAMTMQLMDHFAVTPELYSRSENRRCQNKSSSPGNYGAADYEVEPDASNASYFLAAAAITRARSHDRRPRQASLQGDVGFADVLHRMGADLIFGDDFITITAPISSKASTSTWPTCPTWPRRWPSSLSLPKATDDIRGLHTLRVKETDRIAALATELKKFRRGYRMEDDSTDHHPAGAHPPRRTSTPTTITAWP